MDVREKLVEMSEQLRYCANVSDCENCKRWDKVCEQQCVDNLLLMAADLIDTVAHGATVQEWISVENRLPDNKEHDWVLAQVVEDNGFMHIPKVVEYRQQRNDWFEETYGWLSEHNGAFTVTHWMPLPPAPEDMK